MASLASDGNYYDACVSLAVTAGINACDAIMVHRVGGVVAGQSHEEAVSRLRKNDERDAANNLARLLALKHKSQYSPFRCSNTDADSSYRRASRLLEIAEQYTRHGKDT